MTESKHAVAYLMGALGLGALLFFGSACDMNFGNSGRYIPAPPQPNPSDPPSRIARLSYLDGPVSFRAAGSGVWTPAVLNRPVTTGDELWTSAGARAELHLGFAAIRLNEGTDFGVLELSDNAFQAKLMQGVIRFTVRRLEHGDAFEIDTPNASITPSQAGEYRVEVSPKANTTALIVRSGEAEVTNPRLAFEVPTGQQARVDHTKLMGRNVTPAPLADRFDQFCQMRDHLEEHAESQKYVSSGVIGAYDLEDCGIWLTSPTLGAYWTPRCVAAGWAPYRVGRWAWIEPWGWTWIDDAPWGFAPFHYGRWASIDGAWSWIPGPVRGQAVFAPALVVFVGGTELGSAAVAWFPLAPKEIYVPAYRASLRYLTNLNPLAESLPTIEPTILPRQPYANRVAPNAMTAVPRAVFTSGRPVEGSILVVGSRAAAAQQLTTSFPPVVPEAASLSGRLPAGTRVARPPQESSQRQVVLRRSPAPTPIPFESRLPLLESHPGQPLDRETVEQLRKGQEPER
ncbi:MAG TPA: DUF6600 domain-containing protein [Bryobacteraceae bacterium]|nr:DUF6600 domain-containing protein [Bryobacteraceae bacterium]